MLFLEPMGGLGNRMRAIASALWLKNELDGELKVIWKENYELNCPYTGLFSADPNFNLVPMAKKYRYLKSSSQTGLNARWIAKIRNKLAGIDFCIQEQDFPQFIRPGKMDLLQVGCTKTNIYIQTCQEFGDCPKDYSVFKPVAPVSDRIAHFTGKFGPHTIGVQIRRSDNFMAVRHSPFALFVGAMQSEISLHQETTFFLCTDDESVRAELIALFGDRIITGREPADRGSLQGMRNAVADMYCLSRTNKILGSYYSSFAEVAAELTGTKLQIVTSTI
jgi:hypothetical protein